MPGDCSRRQLLAGLGLAVAAPALADDLDDRLAYGRISFTLPNGRLMTGYSAEPRRARPIYPKVLLLHDNLGLNEAVRAEARQLAAAGAVVIVPDMLTAVGETPRQGDDRFSADDIARALTARRPMADALADALGCLAFVEGFDNGGGVPCAIGLGWGGTLALELAIAAKRKLRAAISFYAPPPESERLADITAGLLLHHDDSEARLAAARPGFEAALKAAGVPFDSYAYANTRHGFENAARPDRYNAVAARLAWQRTLAFIAR